MSILTRPKFYAQERLDLEDLESLMSGMRTDSVAWTKNILAEGNRIMSGFAVSGVGSNELSITVDGSSLLIAEGSSDFSYYTAPSGSPTATISASDLTSGVTNYVEVRLATVDESSATKAFWDPDGDSGAGAEFNQDVNTQTSLDLVFSVNTVGFTGGDYLGIAEVVLHSTGVVLFIHDRRKLFGQLENINLPRTGFTWGQRGYPAAYTAYLDSVIGTFVAGENISIAGTIFSTVRVGGTSSIVFAGVTSTAFSFGDAVVGLTSGATATLDGAFEAFDGTDKDLGTVEDVLRALMNEVKEIKGGAAWWEESVRDMTEINEYLDQLRIKPHPTNGQRFIITGADKALENLTSLGLSVDDKILDFDGAEIDIDTGTIYDSDGTTALGTNYTPPTVAASQYRWLSVTLVTGSTLGNNTNKGIITVDIGSADGATAAAAAKADFASGIHLGQVVIQRNAGNTAFEDITESNIIAMGLDTPTSGSASGNDTMEEFTSSGTFVVPAGITRVYITAVGGGGGGGGGGANAINSNGAAGGGGGGGSGACVVKYPVSVTPLASITVTIGALGTGGLGGISPGGGTGVDGADGVDGGDTIFGGLLTVGGGGKGLKGLLGGASATRGLGGDAGDVGANTVGVSTILANAGVAGSGGGASLLGGNGGEGGGSYTSPEVSGGIGGSGYGVDGVDGVDQTAQFGGGGGGGGGGHAGAGLGNSDGGDGGDGGAGYLLVEWS